MYGWRKTVTLEPLLVLAMAACLYGLPGSALGTSGREAECDYLVDYVSPSLLSRPATPQSRSNLANGMRTFDEGTAARAPIGTMTSGDRWLGFEREYGIQQKNRSWFLSMLQSAKYGLDKLSFTAKETANRFQFTYDIGSPTGPSGVTREPQYSLPLFGTFGHPQLKSVLTEHDPQTGTPFIGLKLAIPFGEGE